MDRNQLATEIAQDLFAAEQATNAAFAANARLAASMARAHTEGGLALEVGADAASSVASSIARLAGSREDLSAAHKRMNVWARAMHMVVQPDTGGGEKPSQGVETAARLRAVG